MENANVPEPSPPPELGELLPVTAPRQAPERSAGFKRADWLALLQNRFILGGLALIAVLLLVMIVLVVFAGGDGGAQRRVSVGQDSTPHSESTVVAGGGLIGNVSANTTMRNGPGPTYAVLGTIRKGARVAIVGRNADETWLQVIYPTGSQIRGWVDASFIDVSGDVSELAIAGPGSSPDVVVPTAAWVPVEPVEPVEPLPTEPPASPTTAPPTATPRTIPTTTPPPPPPPTNTPPAPATPQTTPAPQSMPTEPLPQ